jgi:Flp pilus assembly protein TadB
VGTDGKTTRNKLKDNEVNRVQSQKDFKVNIAHLPQVVNSYVANVLFSQVLWQNASDAAARRFGRQVNDSFNMSQADLKEAIDNWFSAATEETRRTGIKVQRLDKNLGRLMTEVDKILLLARPLLFTVLATLLILTVTVVAFVGGKG